MSTTVVALAARDADGHDLVGEPAGVDGRQGPFVGADGEGVAVLARVPYTRATSSAVSGMENAVLPSRESSPERNAGLVKRQPMDVSKTAPGLAKALVGFSMTQGARLIDSTPPATTMSAAPALIMWEAMMMADRPEAQRRLTVMPGTVSGKPCQEPGHAGHVAVLLAGAVGVAEDHFVHDGRIDAGAFDGGAHRECRKVVGAHAGERAAVAAHGRAGSANEEGLSHVCSQRVASTPPGFTARTAAGFTDQSFYKQSQNGQGRSNT